MLWFCILFAVLFSIDYYMLFVFYKVWLICVGCYFLLVGIALIEIIYNLYLYFDQWVPWGEVEWSLQFKNNLKR